MRRILLAFAAAAILAPTAALAEPERAYEVAIVLSDEGCDPVAMPAFRIIVGGSARMVIQGDFRIDTTLAETEDGRLSLDTTVFNQDALGWTVQARPIITLGTDGRAAVVVPSEAWDRVQVSIRPTT